MYPAEINSKSIDTIKLDPLVTLGCCQGDYDSNGNCVEGLLYD